MWLLLKSAVRASKREMAWISAVLFAFLPRGAAADGAVQPATGRMLLDAVRKLLRVIAAYLVAVSVLLLLYRGAMARLGKTPPRDVVAVLS